MPITLYNDAALHEAGHCIIAYLNSEFFNTEFVTIDNTLSKFHDSNSIGGLKGRLKKDGETLTFAEYDQMALLTLAGMAADDVNHCNCQLSEKLYDNSVFAEKMNSNKYSGDVMLLGPLLQRIVPQLKVPQRAYTMSCQKLLHEILIEPEITCTMVTLRNALTNSNKKTLTGDEIFFILDDSPLKKLKEIRWKEIIEGRTAFYKLV